MTELESLCSRSYDTYRARLQASKRLAFRNRLWNASLVALSIGLVLGSIGMLADDRMYGPKGDTLLVALAVMQLSASLVVSGLNYGGRSRDMFTNYRRMQRLSVAAENLNREPSPEPAAVRALSDEYQMLLDESENHTSADFYRASKRIELRDYLAPGIFLSLVPITLLLAGVAIVVPFMNWIMHGK